MRNRCFLTVLAVCGLLFANIGLGGEIPSDYLQDHQRAVAAIEAQGGKYYPEYPSTLDPPPSHLNLARWKGTDYSIISDIYKLDSIYLADVDGAALRAIDIPELRFIDFSGGSFSNEDFIEFIGKCPKLENLALIKPENITDEGVTCLQSQEHLYSIQFMDVKITDEGLKSLPPRLRMLNVVNCDITPRALETIGKLPDMEYLRLSTLPVKDADLEKLAGLRNLKSLNLRSASLTNAGLMHLSNLTQLEVLHLGGTAINDRGLSHLANLKKLKSMLLYKSRCTKAGLSRLQESIWGKEPDRDNPRYSVIKRTSNRRTRRR